MRGSLIINKYQLLEYIIIKRFVKIQSEWDFKIRTFTTFRNSSLHTYGYTLLASHAVYQESKAFHDSRLYFTSMLRMVQESKEAIV